LFSINFKINNWANVLNALSPVNDSLSLNTFKQYLNIVDNIFFIFLLAFLLFSISLAFLSVIQVVFLLMCLL